MSVRHLSSSFPAIGLAAAVACSAPFSVSAEVVTQTNPVAYEFMIPAPFNLERVTINGTGTTMFRFDFGEILEYQVGTQPYTADIGVGYHHQNFQYGSYGYGSSLRNEFNTPGVRMKKRG